MCYDLVASLGLEHRPGILPSSSFSISQKLASPPGTGFAGSLSLIRVLVASTGVFCTCIKEGSLSW